jgi:hypothetical protein
VKNNIFHPRPVRIERRSLLRNINLIKRKTEKVSEIDLEAFAGCLVGWMASMLPAIGGI